MELDLQPFCSTDECRPYLMKPFSVGEFTYATNGHIMVRVPRRDGVPDKLKEFDQDKPLEGHDTANYAPLSGTLPAMEKEECTCYDGREHNCPDCDCICERCDGSGAAWPHASTAIGGVNFDTRYVAMILALPGLEIAQGKPEEPLLFRFEGGIGALMALRGGQRATHIEIEQKAA